MNDVQFISERIQVEGEFRQAKDFKIQVEASENCEVLPSGRPITRAQLNCCEGLSRTKKVIHKGAGGVPTQS
jgi:hypothetical protein